MDRQSVLDAFESEVEPNADVQRAEFRIFRPNGILSAIYFTAFEDETIAALEAEKIARLGYQVEIWRGGKRTDQIRVQHS
jgi:hypothetical protein